MAKKKLNEAQDEVAQAQALEIEETNPQTPENEASDASESHKEAEAPSPQPEPESKQNPATPDIPSKALDYLKRHPEMESAYIDKLGGVFASTTPKVFVKGAVLYQNPYHKQ